MNSDPVNPDPANPDPVTADPGNHDAPGPSRRRTPGLIIGVAVVVVLVVLAGVLVWSQASSGSSSTPSPATTPSLAGGSTGAAAPASSHAVPAGCSTDPSPIVPVSMQIDRMGVHTNVLSLGLDADNAAAAPPKDEPSTAAWYNKGPRPGSARGKVVLTIHTYHRGGALGNALHDPGTGLRKGDIIRLTSASGSTVCYRYDRSLKVAVKDYDPDSTILYDTAGRPMVAIVICWDYDAARADWDSRVIYYASQLPDSH